MRRILSQEQELGKWLLIFLAARSIFVLTAVQRSFKTSCMSKPRKKQRPRGRPKNSVDTKTVGIRLDVAMIAELDEEGRRTAIHSRSSIIRVLVREALDQRHRNASVQQQQS